ncbi:carbamoyltransferase HypF [Desulfovibrio cuneatus]|uniref:carbamoyltransferase HypF n=1 Tax=Desulfovibrio cuneatus TaxID=159728 RepID=UPI000421C047|nr:carbamoyltransferase HypF [Desulfovibrio cuneatus]
MAAYPPTSPPAPTARWRFTVQGQVQGVGFRPFVFVQAAELGLSGLVGNTPQGVNIEVQGPPTSLERFRHALHHSLPPLARITQCLQEQLPVVPHEAGFCIAQSQDASTHNVLISPDTGMCEACGNDISQPHNRRFGYAFTNCTNCGPRYSITRHMPYDRHTTSMACFPMCPACQQEYGNPLNRRFHAQPNACPVCGPKVWYVGTPHNAPQQHAGIQPNTHPNTHPGTHPENAALQGAQAMEQAAALLAGGGILALKGLGGFHLACHAFCAPAVGRLRQRKNRPHKPFAVMVPHLHAAQTLAHVSAEEEALLCSIERPIVLCRLRPALRPLLAGISPDTPHIGIMLPYTPLHFVLFQAVQQRLEQSNTSLALPHNVPLALVMTSGNPQGQPICLGNREALQRLAPLAEGFLLHNRDILIRVDDSVVRHVPGCGPLFYRRARGFVPQPTALPLPQAEGQESVQPLALPCIVAAGADLKNTLCLTKGPIAFVSQHIGDMDSLENALFHGEIHTHLTSLLGVTPTLAVADAHPGYASSAHMEGWSAEHGVPLLRVQHHTAHAFAVLAENGHSAPALALTLDGTGYSDDGTLWGGEMLLCHPANGVCTRLASLTPLALPGGEAAIREPWRIAHALLLDLGCLACPEATHTTGGYPLPWCLPVAEGLGPRTFPAATPAALRLLGAMLQKNIQCPTSSSLGRWFDAVAALLGLCLHVTYEGQAAIRLEEAQWPEEEVQLKTIPVESAKRGSRGVTPFAGTGGQRPPINENTIHSSPFPHTVAPLLLPPAHAHDVPRFNTRALFHSCVQALEQGSTPAQVAALFHSQLAHGLASVAGTLAKQHSVQHVGLAGGCLQNATLLRLLCSQLRTQGLTPLYHTQLPPNDGSIALGQAFYALCRRGQAHSA